MRAAFGLVGVLITLGVIVWFLGPGGFLKHQKDVIDTGRQAHESVSQIAGRDNDDGTPAKESVTLQMSTSGGKTDSIFVANVKAGGAYEKYFGLQRKDSIVDIGPLSVRDQITSREDADAFLQDAYQKHQQITVIRAGQKLTLPVAAVASPVKKTDDNPLQSQLDAIKNGGH